MATNEICVKYCIKNAAINYCHRFLAAIWTMLVANLYARELFSFLSLFNFLITKRTSAEKGLFREVCCKIKMDITLYGKKFLLFYIS